MAENQTPLCLVCYKPMSVIDDNDVPVKVDREFACGLKVNVGMVEDTGWIWCPDCRYYSHLPTIERLLESYRDMIRRHNQDIKKTDH